MNDASYLNCVKVRLQEILNEEARLPFRFQVTRVLLPQRDYLATFVIEALSVGDGIYETGQVFDEIQQRLLLEFQNDPEYVGIYVSVPHRFLGKKHVDQVINQQRQQALDNQTFRRIRRDSDSCASDS